MLLVSGLVMLLCVCVCVCVCVFYSSLYNRGFCCLFDLFLIAGSVVLFLGGVCECMCECVWSGGVGGVTLTQR